MLVTVVGVDAASDDAKIGLVLAEWGPDNARVHQVVLCERRRRPADVVCEWLAKARPPALIAIDAPLGWPVALAPALAAHRAGAEIASIPNEMFRRTTDRFIQKTIGKTPLDIGADRIARTAHAALALLAELRRRLGVPIPLAWSPHDMGEVSAIEVYPAATLLARGFRADGYKDRERVDERREIIRQLGNVIELPSDVAILERSADALDAVVCALTAKDFLNGEALPPQDPASAEREGWIWVRPRGYTPQSP